MKERGAWYLVFKQNRKVCYKDIGIVSKVILRTMFERDLSNQHFPWVETSYRRSSYLFQTKELDEVVEKLQSNYFATYGFSFPQTGMYNEEI